MCVHKKNNRGTNMVGQPPARRFSVSQGRKGLPSLAVDVSVNLTDGAALPPPAHRPSGGQNKGEKYG